MTEDIKAEIKPVELNENSTFQFKCHPGVSCFTNCCRNINIMLTPYDIIKLKNRMEIDSSEFLAVYTEPNMLEKTDLPVITMRMLDDERKSCPFVRDGEGCIIYEDRPTICRYYPVGFGSLSHKMQENEDKDFFFLIKEPMCKGHLEKNEMTVKEWRQDQGIEERDRINSGWMDLVVRKQTTTTTMKFTEKSKKLFFMVCYNIDAFRRFVFESGFKDMYNLDETLLEKFNDDIELLQFGFAWLKAMFFQIDPSGLFQVDNDKAEERLKK
jgi:hypothetical protein